MKSPVCNCLSKIQQKHAKIEEQGKKGACYREPSVLVTFYVVKPMGSHQAAAHSPSELRQRHRHHQGTVQGASGGGYNRREELLRYCQHLRMSAVDQAPPPPPHQPQRSLPRVHLPNEPQQHDEGKKLLKKLLTSLRKKIN